MKKFLVVVAVMFSLTALGGCKKNEQVEEPRVQELNMGIEKKEQDVVDPSKTNETIEIDRTPEKVEMKPQGEIKLEEKFKVFDFSDAEKAAFENYSVSFDPKEFKDLTPVSLAKIWVQFAVSNAWESEYNMYAPSTLKGENYDYTDKQLFYNYFAAFDKNYNSMDENIRLSKKEMADLIFDGLENAVFVEESPEKGYVELTGDPKKPYIKLNFLKVDGIWRPVFNSLITEQPLAAQEAAKAEAEKSQKAE